MKRNGIKPCSRLQQRELEEIKRLALSCNQADGIRLKLNWDMLEERSSEVTNDFLYYHDGILVGFLGIYMFKSSEAEINGMVHPEYRRQGIFSTLVEGAKRVCEERKIPELLFICQSGCVSGSSFVEAAGAKYSFSEYRMELDPHLYQQHRQKACPFERTQTLQARVKLRQATRQDVELLVELNREGFSMTERDTRDYVDQTIGAETDKTYIAELDRLPIGKLGIQIEGNSAYMYGFCVKTAFRGQGYGRTILTRTITKLLEQQHVTHIVLEVAVKNEGALRLYESCGFIRRYVYDYYSYKGHAYE